MQIPDSKRLVTAGRELIKGNIENVVKAFTTPDEQFAEFLRTGGSFEVGQTSSMTYRGSDSALSAEAGDIWDYFVDGNGYNYFKYSGIKSCQIAYMKCPPLASIINKMAQAYINGKTWVLDKKNKEANTTEATRIKTWLRKPNPLQSWKQFEAQRYIYKKIFGFSITLCLKPAGFSDNIYTYQQWNIPPSMLDIYESDRLFYQTDLSGVVSAVILNYKGERTALKVADLMIVRDFVPSFASMVFPESRISLLQGPINNIIGAYESRGTLIKHRGALGIFTQAPQASNPMGGTLPITDPEKLELQAALRRYGLGRNQMQHIITKASLKWEQIGTPVKDLMLFEEIEDDTMQLCDAFNFPFRLMGQFRANSLGGSDAEVFTRNLYQDSIIPECESDYEEVNGFLGTDKYGIRVDKDFKHVPALQGDKVKEAQARKTMNEGLLIEFQNNMLTLNRWLELNGEDGRGPEGDKYYTELIELGWTFGAKVTPASTNDNENGTGTEETGDSAENGGTTGAAAA